MTSPLSLCDVNASYGKSATGQADFPTLANRLREMNRLGIGRALVWNIEAAQHHSLSCNRTLIDAIRRTPGARGRIVPALVVAGIIKYERDGIATLRRQMEEGQTRALRFVASIGQHNLCQLEPVIRSVSDRRPFVILRHDAVSIEDILEFTRLLPETPVILTEAMWPPHIKVLDLMRRRPNILIDNSWLHTYGALDLGVKHFGASRFVFGTGPACHNGAPIAAVARAGISPAQRELIAHGNLDRLLGLAAPAPRAAAMAGHQFWKRFLEGKPLGTPVVDAHLHIGPSAGYVIEEQTEEGQIRLALRDAKRIGFRTMVISGLQALLGDAVKGNDRLETLLRPHSGLLKGYVAFNPFFADQLVKRFKRYFAGRVFVGFKTLCDYWRVPITDPRFKPMWEYANAHRLPVLMHTWDGDYDSPAMMKDLVDEYPDVSFLFGHSGGGNKGRQEVTELAEGHPNVFLEWCGSFCSTIRWEETLAKVGVRQVVFGTDAMAHDFDWELGRLLSLDVPDSKLIPILGQNMQRVLARRQ
jgi:predicted TIM-barrel fold metal-dependent hydrolase